LATKPPGVAAPLGGLSGGTVRRGVLARGVNDGVRVLIVANPCFGLDFKAVAEIRSRIMQARNRGVAAYLASEPTKAGAAKNKEPIELGKRIYPGGIAENRVPACASCHGPAGAGMPAAYPRVGGQHQDYTVATLKAFKADARKTSPEMHAIAYRMSDKEIEAVADYMAGLK